MRRFLNRNVLFVDLCHAASRQVCSLFNRQKPSRQRRRKGRGRTARRLPLSVEQCERRLALDATAGDGGFLDVVPGWGSDGAGVVVESVDGGSLSIMLSAGSGANFEISAALTTGILSLPARLPLNTLETSGRITLRDSGQVSATATSASVTSDSVIMPWATASPARSVPNPASAVESILGESSWSNPNPILGGPVVSGNDFVIAPGNEGLVITADDLSLESVITRIDINVNAGSSFYTSVNPVETKGDIASPITNNLPRYTQTVDTAPPVQADTFLDRVDSATDMPSMSSTPGNSEDSASDAASVRVQRVPTGNNSSIGSERSRGPSLATSENENLDVLALQTSEPQAVVLEAGDFVIVAAAASSTTLDGDQGGLLDLNAVVAQTQQAETARFVAVAFHGSSDSRSFPHWHQPSMHQPSPEVARASVFEVAAVGERTVVAPPTSKADAQQASPNTDQLSAIETSLRSMLPPETWHHDQISHAMEAALTAVFAAGVFWADEALRSQALSTHNQRVQLASQKRRPW